MIESLRYGPKTAEFAGCRSAKFKPGVNLLVGPNGSGKSITLASLNYRAKEAQDGHRPKGVKFRGKVAARLFDTEHMNPHVMNAANVMSSASLMQVWFGSARRSHGQCLAPYLTTGMDGEIKKCREKLKEGESLTMLIDEPESGLDQASLTEFVRVVRKWSCKVQFIIATHSVWIWRELGGHFVVLGQDQDYVKNTLKAWEAVWGAKRKESRT